MAFPSPTDRQARILWLSLTALAIAILLGLIGLLLWGFGWVLNQLSTVLLPIAVGGILAYLLDPVVDFLEKRKLNRTVSILSVFLLAILLIALLIATVVPRLVRETETLVSQWPAYRRSLQLKLEEWKEDKPFGLRIPAFWRFGSSQTNVISTNAPTNGTQPFLIPSNTNAVSTSEKETATRPFLKTDTAQKILAWFASVLPEVGRWFLTQLSRVASWVGLLIGFSLVPVYTFYFLLEKQGIQRSWTDYLPIHESRTKEELVFVIRAINDYLILFFRGQVLVALCDAVLYTGGLLAIGLNYSFLLGLLAGLLSIVPFLGFVIGLVPALILAAVQFGDWLHPLLVLIVFGLVQLIEGLVISPKIMGDRVGLHPVTIIIAVMVGTTLMGGIIGGILAIPLTAALRVLMFRYIWKRSGAPEHERTRNRSRSRRESA